MLLCRCYCFVADVVQVKVQELVVSVVLALMTPAQLMVDDPLARVIVVVVLLVEKGDGTPPKARLRV